MRAPRRSEKSHELTAEERSRGGRMRAAKIYTAKAEAAAQGKPYKPLRRRRRSSFGFRGDPYARPPSPEPVAALEPEVELPGDDEHAARLALRTMAGWFAEDADGVPFRFDPENDLALAYDTDPPRRVPVDFRISESVPIDEDEFRNLVKAARAATARLRARTSPP